MSTSSTTEEEPLFIPAPRNVPRLFENVTDYIQLTTPLAEDSPQQQQSSQQGISWRNVSQILDRYPHCALYLGNDCYIRKAPIKFSPHDRQHTRYRISTVRLKTAEEIASESPNSSPPLFPDDRTDLKGNNYCFWNADTSGEPLAELEFIVRLLVEATSTTTATTTTTSSSASTTTSATTSASSSSESKEEEEDETKDKKPSSNSDGDDTTDDGDDDESASPVLEAFEIMDVRGWRRIPSVQGTLALGAASFAHLVHSGHVTDNIKLEIQNDYGVYTIPTEFVNSVRLHGLSLTAEQTEIVLGLQEQQDDTTPLPAVHVDLMECHLHQPTLMALLRESRRTTTNINTPAADTSNRSSGAPAAARDVNDETNDINDRNSTVVMENTTHGDFLTTPCSITAKTLPVLLQQSCVLQKIHLFVPKYAMFQSLVSALGDCRRGSNNLKEFTVVFSQDAIREWNKADWEALWQAIGRCAGLQRVSMSNNGKRSAYRWWQPVAAAVRNNPSLVYLSGPGSARNDRIVQKLLDQHVQPLIMRNRVGPKIKALCRSSSSTTSGTTPATTSELPNANNTTALLGWALSHVASRGEQTRYNRGDRGFIFSRHAAWSRRAHHRKAACQLELTYMLMEQLAVSGHEFGGAGAPPLPLDRNCRNIHKRPPSPPSPPSPEFASFAAPSMAPMMHMEPMAMHMPPMPMPHLGLDNRDDHAPVLFARPAGRPRGIVAPPRPRNIRQPPLIGPRNNDAGQLAEPGLFGLDDWVPPMAGFALDLEPRPPRDRLPPRPRNDFEPLAEPQIGQGADWEPQMADFAAALDLEPGLRPLGDDGTVFLAGPAGVVEEILPAAPPRNNNNNNRPSPPRRPLADDSSDNEDSDDDSSITGAPLPLSPAERLVGVVPLGLQPRVAAAGPQRQRRRSPPRPVRGNDDDNDDGPRIMLAGPYGPHGLIFEPDAGPGRRRRRRPVVEEHGHPLPPPPRPLRHPRLHHPAVAERDDVAR